MDLTVKDDPNQGKPLRSFSQYSMYMRCPQLYKATYIDKSIKRSGNIKMHLGSSLHYAHETLCNLKLSGEELTEEKALENLPQDFEN